VTIENETVVVFITAGIVSVDFHDFGDEASPWAAFEMHNDVHRIANVGFDGPVWQFHTTLEHAARESSQGLPR
jgi:hypothetical protein